MYKETLLDFPDHIFTFIGAFLGIGAIGFLNKTIVSVSDNVFLIGSFGASAVLIYGISNSPLAQPRNLIGGHLISALIGVTVRYFIPSEIWLACAFSGAFSIVAMQITKTLHPPGGATALIANIGSQKIRTLGYWYVLSPVLSGALILFFFALIVNNINPQRHYPSNKKWGPVLKKVLSTRWHNNRH